jgi:hypothetical protein
VATAKYHGRITIATASDNGDELAHPLPAVPVGGGILVQFSNTSPMAAKPRSVLVFPDGFPRLSRIAGASAIRTQSSSSWMLVRRASFVCSQCCLFVGIPLHAFRSDESSGSVCASSAADAAVERAEKLLIAVSLIVGHAATCFRASRWLMR